MRTIVRKISSTCALRLEIGATIRRAQSKHRKTPLCRSTANICAATPTPPSNRLRKLRPNLRSRSNAFARQVLYLSQPREHLVGEESERLVAQRRAKQIFEEHLLPQACKLVDYRIRRPVDDHTVEVAFGRIRARFGHLRIDPL